MLGRHMWSVNIVCIGVCTYVCICICVYTHIHICLYLRQKILFVLVVLPEEFTTILETAFSPMTCFLESTLTSNQTSLSQAAVFCNDFWNARDYAITYSLHTTGVYACVYVCIHVDMKGSALEYDLCHKNLTCCSEMLDPFCSLLTGVGACVFQNTSGNLHPLESSHQKRSKQPRRPR